MTFILFASQDYYPFGGLQDCRGVFGTREACDAAAAALPRPDRDDCHALQVPEMLVHHYKQADGSFDYTETLETYLARV